MNKNLFVLIKRLIFLLKFHKKLLVFASISIILLSVLSPLRPYLIGQTIDKYIIKDQNQELLFIWIFIIFFSLIIEGALQVASTFYSNLLAQNLILELRMKLFSKISKLKIRYFDNNHVGTLVTRTVSDMQAITEVFSSGLMDIIGDLLALFLILILMFITNWELALMTLVPIPILFIATKIFANTMKKAYQKERAAVTSLNNFVNERLSGMTIVQLFFRQKQQLQKFDKINKEHRAAHFQTIFANSIFFPVVEVLSSLSIAFILVVASVKATGKSGSDIKEMYGEIIAFTLWISQLYRPIRQLADKFNILQRGAVRAERVFELLDMEEESEKEDKKEKVDFNQVIKFSNVSFSYDTNTPFVLNNINLQFEPGKTYAIVGPTGSGKTTLISLLSRFYSPVNGKILIGKTPLDEISREELSKKLGLVLQDVFLFSGSVKDNILLGKNNIDQEQLERAAIEVGAHDFITKLPNGYEYKIGERGLDLSVGQRQLISFLRVYIHNPEILILDEATSSIDSASEKLIQEAIEKITVGRTSIIIAHRLSTIQKADLILVVSEGEIKEQGSHLDLLSNTKGHYYNLYSKQLINNE